MKVKARVRRMRAEATTSCWNTQTELLSTVPRPMKIKITPFNLKEEQQEGSFSKDGNFVWNKKDEVKDAWLDNVDMQKVRFTSQHVISILFSLSLI